MFSVVFTVWAQELKFYVNSTSFPGTLTFVAGHATLWGWYVAAFRALEAGNNEYLASLVQAVLTATIQSKIVQERSSLAVIRIGISNTVYVPEQTLAESCPAFAEQLNVALPGVSMRGGSGAAPLVL